jgi:hypothetical protein
MAERNAVSNKLKLVVTYKDADNKEKNRQITFAKLKANAQPDALVSVATAIAGLQSDTLTKIVETTENLIEA